MGVEIERKFLVVGDAWRTDSPIRICQGYLSRSKECTVRVRIAGDAAALTIKGVNVGATRAEYEYSIPVEDAEELLKLCEGPVIKKERHILVLEGTKWEVDEFGGANSGLVVAEVELESESQVFQKPGWLGVEVTGDSRYYNSNLAVSPYREWGEQKDA